LEEGLRVRKSFVWEADFLGQQTASRYSMPGSKDTEQELLHQVEEIYEQTAQLRRQQPGPPQAENDLQRLQSVLQYALDEVPGLAMLVDRDYQAVMIGQVAVKPDSIREQITEPSTCHALLHKSDTPCDQRGHRCPLAEVVATNSPVTVTHSLFDADGNQRCIQVRGYPVCVATNEASYMLETCRDITEPASLEEREWRTLDQQLREHKSQLAKMSAALEAERAKSRKLEATLHATRHHLRRLLAAAQTYMYTVHYENGEPQSTEHGEGCSAVTGYTQEDFQSDPYLWIAMVHTSDQDVVKEHVGNIGTTEDIPKLEHRITRKDGTTRWVRSTIVRDFDSTGQVLCYHGLIQDITDLKEVQSSLQEKRAQLLAAQKIQEHLLPTIAPNLPGFDIAGRLYPAEFTAGDCFDYLFMPDGSLGLAVCDVSGHDFGAALLMASLSAHLRWLAQTRTDVAEVLGLANLILANDAEDNQFSSLLLARLDVEARHLVYANAGCNTSSNSSDTG
jgi:PAS domain S-box-containing protein